MRATNLVIGTTTLAVIGAALTGLIVFQKINDARNQSQLRIVFNGSASGLRRGGAVTFDGVPAGQILSIKLENPRKIVALVTLDNNAPLRKDTAVGIEFQGLTGVADIALVGGAPSRAAGAARPGRHPRPHRRLERAAVDHRHPA